VTIPRFEAGHAVLVAADEMADAHRLVVDLVQEGHVTLAHPEGEALPDEWTDCREVFLTYVDRFSVVSLPVPVVRQGTTRLVIGEPATDAVVQRRQYARVLTPLPAACLLLDTTTNRFTPFDATVHDLGGGGLAMRAGAIAPAGATMVVSLALPGEPPVVTVGTILPSDGAPTRDRRRAVRLEFTLIREADRDRILRFVLLSIAGARRG
jgi:hypothetical protein